MKKDRKKIWTITGKWIVKKRHGWYWTFRPSNWCYLDCCESKSEAKELCRELNKHSHPSLLKRIIYFLKGEIKR